MPKGYVILTEDIHDPAAMAEYSAASAAPLVDHGGRVLVVDENVEVLEGEWHGTRTVVVEYSSVEQARKWYHSDGYQAVLPLREGAANCNVVIAMGFTLGDAGQS
jgi:uncharacterized protein (DUF1330 family)